MRLPEAERERCGAVNLRHGDRCDRDPGHDGAHIADVGHGVRAWGFTIGPPAGASTEGSRDG